MAIEGDTRADVGLMSAIVMNPAVGRYNLTEYEGLESLTNVQHFSYCGARNI